MLLGLLQADGSKAIGFVSPPGLASSKGSLPFSKKSALRRIRRVRLRARRYNDVAAAGPYSLVQAQFRLRAHGRESDLSGSSRLGGASPGRCRVRFSVQHSPGTGAPAPPFSD